MTLKPVFPLPKGYFGKTELSPAQKARCCDIVRTQLARTLADEHEFVYANNRRVDATKWRLVKRKHQMRIFRRRAPALTSSEDTSRPSMMSVGRMEGTLEDVLYGSYNKSHEEIWATMTVVAPSARDCTVLHNIELATPSDPFHYVGIKWLLTPLPASAFVKPRDWCYIKALGIEHDSQGNRFGFQILHSVDLAHCPAFDRRAVVRGKTQLAFIFRELVPGVIEVFSEALFDPAGEIIQYFSTIMTTYALTATFRNVECAEAKKLTLLALRNVAGGKLLFDELQKYCFLCRGTGSMLSALKACRICSVTVCSQCRVRRRIFIGPAHAVCNVSCCRMCLKQARGMNIRPAEPGFSILGDQYLSPDQFWDPSNGSSDSHDDDESPTPHSGDGDFDDDLSELDADSYRFSNETGYSEDDIEKIIASNPGAATAHQRATTPTAAAGLDPDLDPTTEEKLSAASASGGSLTREQAAIFEKILALQSVANEVYSIAQANNEMMRSLK